MIFRPEMIEAIEQGRKTMTRRRSNRYRVGRVYSVQPGRGKRGVGISIQILEKGRERLRQISAIEAQAEGFPNRQRFFEYWAAMHGGLDLDSFVWAYAFRVV